MAPDLSFPHHLTPDSPSNPDLWYRGRYLPHFTGRNNPVFITFRLADSVPNEVLERWKWEARHMKDCWRQHVLRLKTNRYMDTGYGECWLKIPEIALEMEDTLLKFDRERYILHSWCIMPNHVHILITITGDSELKNILHSWESYTSNKANAFLGRSGQFWYPDYFDRGMRSEAHYNVTMDYIDYNPVKAGLCEKPENWRWGSAYYREKGFFQACDSCPVIEREG